MFACSSSSLDQHIDYSVRNTQTQALIKRCLFFLIDMWLISPTTPPSCDVTLALSISLYWQACCIYAVSFVLLLSYVIVVLKL